MSARQALCAKAATTVLTVTHSDIVDEKMKAMLVMNV